jgi:hypothetical protein
VRDRRGAKGAVARLVDEDPGVAERAGHKDRALDAADDAVEGHDDDDDGDADEDGQVETDHPPSDDKRCHQRSDAQNEEDVGDVAADDVAEGHVRLAPDGGRDGHGQLGRAGPECDDGEAHDDGRDAGGRRESGRAADEEIRAARQQAESDEEQQDHERFTAGARLVDLSGTNASCSTSRARTSPSSMM